MSHNPSDTFPYIIATPESSQIRGALIGAPGTGKTTGAVTFPNVVVLDFDRKCPPGVPSIPFWDTAVEKSWLKGGYKSSAIPYGPRYGLIHFLQTEGPKFSPDTTLVLDSWTSMMNKLDNWQNTFETQLYYSNKKKEVDGFQLHGDRLAMAVEISNTVKELKCNFIYIFHEQIERDKDGNPLTSIKPLMKGQFADQFSAHITFFFRACHSLKWQSNGGYHWRVKANDVFKPITPHRFQVPETGCIDATYEAYSKQLL
jgi:hypothetical protein